MIVNPVGKRYKVKNVLYMLYMREKESRENINSEISDS